MLLLYYSASVAKKDVAIGERDAFLDALRAKRLHLEEALQSVNTEVIEVRQRRQRMTYLEDVLKKEAQIAEDEARAATAAADKLLRKLERDAAKVKSKVVKTKANVEHRKDDFVKMSNAKASVLSKEIAKAEVVYSKIAKGIMGKQTYSTYLLSNLLRLGICVTPCMMKTSEIEELESAHEDSALKLSELRDRIRCVEIEGERAMEEQNERLRCAQIEVRSLRLDTSQLEAKVEALESDYQRRFQALPIDAQRRLIESFQNWYNMDDLGSGLSTGQEYDCVTALYDNDPLRSDIDQLPRPSISQRYIDCYTDDSDTGDHPVSSIAPLSESPNSVTSYEPDGAVDMYSGQLPHLDTGVVSKAGGKIESYSAGGDIGVTRKHRPGIPSSLKPKVKPTAASSNRSGFISASTNGKSSEKTNFDGKSRRKSTRISSRLNAVVIK
jgi:ElaB/YqjD/DUF883 family membrane-anchored ribosome-binding protein